MIFWFVNLAIKCCIVVFQQLSEFNTFSDSQQKVTVFFKTFKTSIVVTTPQLPLVQQTSQV